MLCNSCTGPEDSRSLRRPDFIIIGTRRWQSCQPYAPHGLCQWKISDTIDNWTRNLRACCAVPHPVSTHTILFSHLCRGLPISFISTGNLINISYKLIMYYLCYMPHPSHTPQYKVVPLQAWTGPDGSRKLRFPDFMTTAQDGDKVVSLTHRTPQYDQPNNICWKAETTKAVILQFCPSIHHHLD